MTPARVEKGTGTGPGGGEMQSGRLIARLNRLATERKQLVAERGTLPAQVQDRVRALVAEVDETVLPRLLVLRSAGEEVGRLVAAHRRLTDVILPGRAPAAAEPQTLVQRAARGILAIADHPGPLTLTATRREAAPHHAEPACSVNALERALGLSSAQSAFRRLAERTAPLALARLTWQESPAAARFTGADGWKTTLEAYAARYAQAAHARKPRIGPSRTEGLAIPLSEDHLLVLARLDRPGFAAILPRKAGFEALANWQRA